jgi:CDP-glycerol glycerophosphotransferase (TagB/SpsB family)
MGDNVKACAFVGDSNFHLLDHIAPLASLWNIPLIANDEETANLAKMYYPEVQIRLWQDVAFRLQEIAEEFDTLLNCQYWEPSLKECFRTVYKKEMQLMFCPHGQSDKGYKSPLLEYYKFQDAILLYGQLLQDMLTELNIWDDKKPHIRVGNYRLSYHQLHKKRETDLAEQHIFSKLDPSNQTLLYAPTWNDADGATSFFLEAERLICELPSHWNLIIKLHPLLAQRDPALFYRIIALEDKRPNFVVVHQFPLIYAILDKIDAYLGDYSSIGYDVLAFRTPMFFWKLRNLPEARLHACGQIIDPAKNTWHQIEHGIKRSGDFIPLQTALYKYAFYSLTGGRTYTNVRSERSPAEAVASRS